MASDPFLGPLFWVLTLFWVLGSMLSRSDEPWNNVKSAAVPFASAPFSECVLYLRRVSRRVSAHGMMPAKGVG